MGSQARLNPQSIFMPMVSRTHTTILECDFNMHKSNSTYFTDLDVARSQFCFQMFGSKLQLTPGSGQVLMLLGGVQCQFRREIKPYQVYNIWSRLLSWDEKWIYIVSHFVDLSVAPPRAQFGPPTKQIKRKAETDHARDANVPPGAVHATAISRFVFKNGRATISPSDILHSCNLLPQQQVTHALEKTQAGKTTFEEIDTRRKQNLPVAQLHRGWEIAHTTFTVPETCLGICSDTML